MKVLSYRGKPLTDMTKAELITLIEGLLDEKRIDTEEHHRRLKVIAKLRS